MAITNIDTDLGLVTLPRAGRYTLVVEQWVAETAALQYSFRATRVADQVADLTLGNTFQGTLGLPLQNAVLRFSLSEESQVNIDPLTLDGNLSWTLVGPGGPIAARNFLNSDSYDFTENPIFTLPAGDYELRVSNQAVAGRDFAIRVSTLAQGQVITPGLPVTGTFSPGSETEVFRFNAQAGEQFYFDRVELAGVSATWRLIGPTGRQLFQGAFNDIEDFVIPQTGEYTLLLEGRIYDAASIGSFAFNVFETTPSDPVVIDPGATAGADLQPAELAVTASGGIFSGGTVTLSWKTQNTGTLASAAGWADRIIVRNLDTNEIIGNYLVDDIGGVLAAGAERQRQTQIVLPQGNSGVGRLSFSLSVDAGNAVAEVNLTGTAETNNAAVVEVQSGLAPFIDLVVSDIAPVPATNWSPGQAVTLGWTTTNLGNSTAPGGFRERIEVRNLVTNQRFVLADRVVTDPLAAGASRDNSLAVTWPAGIDAHGEFSFTVTTDILDTVAEANQASTGESNNSHSETVVSGPDVTIADLAIAQTDPAAGDTLTVSWIEGNAGNVATLAGFSNRIFVQNLVTGQVLLDTVVTTDAVLAAGQTRSKSMTFTLPDGLASVGQVRVTVFADRGAGGAAGTVREVASAYNAEGNNTAGISVDVDATAYADLAATNVVVPVQVNGGGTATISWRITNNGTATAAAGWRDRIILSADNVLGNADDIVLGERERTSPLLATRTYTASLDVAIPANIGGNYKVFVVADAGGDVREPDTRTDNVSAPANMLIISQAPNLVADAVFGPVTPVAGGETFTVSWRVRNTGDAVAPGGHVDRIVLSADGVADAGDLVLAEVPRNAALAAGASYSVSVPVSVQDGRIGNYRLILVTDAGQTVFENLAEADNTGVSTPIAFTSAPAANLVVESISVPEGGVPGQTVEVTYVIRNTGSEPASAPWADRIYIDSDTTISGASSLATVNRTFDLAPGASYEVKQLVTLPASLGDADYHIMVRSDANNDVFEGGLEADNDRASLSLVLAHPDLVPENLSHDGGPDLVSNTTITVNWAIRNNGSAPTLDGWTDEVWLSLDGAVGAGDIKLGELAALGPLALGATYLGSLDVLLPLAISGNFKLLLRTDGGGRVVELAAGEANNITATDLVIGLAPYADLAVSNVQAPALTVQDPARVTVSWTVSNTGTGRGATESWVDRVYVSRDDVLGDADDILLGELLRTGGLAAGGDYDASLDLILPPGFNGRFTLYVRSDAADAVFENGADGNRTAMAGPFDVSPFQWADLFVADVGVPAVAQSGSEITVSWDVGNQGPGLTNSSSWYDEVYLERADGTGRVRLGAVNHLGFLAPGANYTPTGTFTLPEGIEGEYRIVVKVPGSDNPNASPYEFIYTDNNETASANFDVSLAPSPDLVVTAISAPETGVEGTVIDIEWTVRNNGQAAASGGWVDRVYLRKVGTTGPGILIGTYSYTGPLAAGTSYTRREEMRLPDRSSDNFEVIVITDATDTVYEHGTAGTNNQRVDDAAILVSLLPRPDLRIGEIVAPDRVSAGGTASIEFTVVNQGLVASNGNWTDQVWLSLDDKLTSDDILVSSHQNQTALGSLAEYRTNSDVFTIPKRFRGTVYVLVKTDVSGSIDEFPNDTDASNVTAHELFVDPIPFADLVVDNVVVPAQAFEGNTVSVRYSVTNRGAGETDLGTWTEQIWLTRDKNRPHPGQGDILLTTLTYVNGVLAEGAGYDRELTVTLPTGLASGTYYITPWVDPYGTLLEDSLATNVNPDDPSELNSSNYRAGAIAIVGTPPQSTAVAIALSDVVADPVGSTDDPFTVSWKVTAGGDVTANGWNETVYLSDTPLLENSTKRFVLGTFTNQQQLDPGASYTRTESFDLNPAAKGMYVIVVGSLPRDNNRLDDQAFGATSVTPDPADFKVVSVIPAALGAPAFSGELTSVTYTVRNDGADVWEGTEYWRDLVYVSKDPVFNLSRATLVGTIAQPAGDGFATEESYTNTVEFTMPPGVEGEYYVYVFTNVVGSSPLPQPLPESGNNDSLRDNTFRNSAYELAQGNSGQSQFPVEYREPDLQVTQLTLPENMVAGGTYEISFRVENVGNRSTREDGWVDRLYLSLDASLDNTDWLMTRETAQGVQIKAESNRNGVLNPGDFYIATVTITMPFELEGDFHVIAMADSGPGQSGFGTSQPVPQIARDFRQFCGHSARICGGGEQHHGGHRNADALCRPRSQGHRSRSTRTGSARAEVHRQLHGGERWRCSSGAAGQLDRSGLYLARSVPRSDFGPLPRQLYPHRRAGCGGELRCVARSDDAGQSGDRCLLRVRGHRSGTPQCHRRGVRSGRAQQQLRNCGPDHPRSSAADRYPGHQRNRPIQSRGGRGCVCQLDGAEHQRSSRQRQLDGRGLSFRRCHMGHQRQAAWPRHLLRQCRGGRQLYAQS